MNTRPEKPAAGRHEFRETRIANPFWVLLVLIIALGVDYGARLLTLKEQHSFLSRVQLDQAQGASKIIELAIDGAKVTPTGQDVAPGKSPYGASVTPDGNWLINTNVGGALDSTDRTGTMP